MTYHTVRALPLLLLSACTFAAEGDDAEESVDSTSSAQVTGTPIGAQAALAKITSPGVPTYKTGIAISSSRILTGSQGLPVGALLVDVPGQQQRIVQSFTQHPQYGVTMLTLTAPIGGNFYAPDTTVPPVGRALTCAGYDTATGSPIGVGLTVSSTNLTGYLGTFAPGQSIGTSDDGVPCRDPATAGFAGLALSTSGGTHTQVAAAHLIPWINDPTDKTLTIRHHAVSFGSGTLSSTPSGVSACNSLAHGHACNLTFKNGSRIEIVATTNSDVTWRGCTSVTAADTCIVHMDGNESVRATYGDCDTCFDDCYDSCIEVFGARPTTCTRQCNSACSACN